MKKTKQHMITLLSKVMKEDAEYSIAYGTKVGQKEHFFEMFMKSSVGLMVLDYFDDEYHWKMIDLYPKKTVEELMYVFVGQNLTK